MKNKLTLTAVAALLLAGSPAYALNKTQVASIKEALKVPAPEMPAKAVEVVKTAPENDREDFALVAVRTVISKHPAAAPVVVAAISREMPELSPAVTRAAIQQAPEHRGNIEKAARAAAPSQAAVIDTVSSQAPIHSPVGVSADADATIPGDAGEVAVRESANHKGSHGTIVVHPGPVRYHRPLPNPPRRPIDPPGLKKFGQPRGR